MGDPKGAQSKRSSLRDFDPSLAVPKNTSPTVSVSNEALTNPFLGTSIEDIASEFARGSPSIYKDGANELLSDTYVPKNLPHREGLIRQVFKILEPALHGRTPSNLFIYGNSGTGKTAAARVVLNLLPKTKPSINVTSVFVDCSTTKSSYGVLRDLANKLIAMKEGPMGRQFGTKLGLPVLYDSIKKDIQERGGLTVVVLDEIDKLLENSGDEVMFSLLNLNTELDDAKVVLVATTNNTQMEQMIGRSTKSRLNEERIHFPPYNQPQLLDIIKSRAMAAFVDGAVDPSALARCAVYAAQEHGDARRAIGILRVAARNADQEGARMITESHVDLARAQLEHDTTADSIGSLPLQQKYVLYVIATLANRNRGAPTAKAIYLNYAALLTGMGMKPLMPRQVRNYLDEFKSLGLLEKNIGNKGRGGGRNAEVQLSIGTDRVLQIIEKDEAFEELAKERAARSGYQARL